MSELEINGYRLQEPLTNENAGFAKWGYAEKDGREYFIKEFLNPVYPTESSPYDARTKEKIRNSCMTYQLQKSLLYREINRVSDGNLLRIEAFFRWGSKYYITTKRIHSAGLQIQELSKRPFPDRLQVCLALSHALMQMHSANIVHADIKPDNILLEKTLQGSITAKLIDVDCSFFEGEPPEELMGDQVYFAPEAVLFMLEGPETTALSCKMDVFAMGLVLHLVLTGELPKLPPDYNYAFEVCLDGQPLVISSELPGSIQNILAEMLATEPGERCPMADVFHGLRNYKLYGEAPQTIEFETFDEEADHTPEQSEPELKQETNASRLRFGKGLDQSNEKKPAAEQKTVPLHSAFHKPGGLS